MRIMRPPNSWITRWLKCRTEGIAARPLELAVNVAREDAESFRHALAPLPQQFEAMKRLRPAVEGQAVAVETPCQSGRGDKG